MPSDRDPPRRPLQRGELAGEQRDVLRSKRTNPFGNPKLPPSIPHVPAQPGHTPIERPPLVRAQTAQPVEFDAEDLTGRYAVEAEAAEVIGDVGAADRARQALASARARRPTDERFAKIEKNRDEDRADMKALTAVVNTTAITVAEIAGQLKFLPNLVERETVTFTSKVEVDTAGKLATIADVSDAKRSRRALSAKIIGGVLTSGLLGAVAHWLLGKAGL